MTSFHLVLKSGPGSGTEFLLDKAELFLGRDPGNDVVINDPEVSRRHARLLKVGDTYSIEDLGSTNGTFIRGMRLAAPVTLRPGEVITLGERVIVQYEVTGLDMNATVAVSRLAEAPTQQPVIPQTPPPAPAAPAYPPQQQPTPSYTPPPSQAVPSYAPVAPPRATAQPVPPPVRKKKSGWLVALLVVLGVLLVFCVIPWIIIEVTNSYCSLFPGIFNAIQPGACL